MGEVALAGLCRMAGRFFALVLLLPAGVLFLAYLGYIAAMVLRELRKK